MLAARKRLILAQKKVRKQDIFQSETMKEAAKALHPVISAGRPELAYPKWTTVPKDATPSEIKRLSESEKFAGIPEDRRKVFKAFLESGEKQFGSFFFKLFRSAEKSAPVVQEKGQEAKSFGMSFSKASE